MISLRHCAGAFLLVKLKFQCSVNWRNIGIYMLNACRATNGNPDNSCRYESGTMHVAANEFKLPVRERRKTE